VDAGVTQGGWSTDSLVETVLELIDLSKVRLLKPDQLPGAGAMLPTTFIPRNLAAEVPSLDLLGIALSEAQVVSATVLGKG
jgi:hypothetical protein